MFGAYIIGIIVLVVSLIAGGVLKSRFRRYAKVPIRSGLSGREVAQQMLADHGIREVKVVSVPGSLSDHYNPLTKTVNLSPDVYNGSNAAAAAVAAHECGHAVQHAQAYSFLRLRTALVPLQNISGRLMNFVVLASIFGGSFLYSTFPLDGILLLIIGCYGVITLFSFVTLPVEFDASRRALAWVVDRGIVSSQEHDMAKDALWWAALTYVIAALGSLATLLYYVSLFLGRRD